MRLAEITHAAVEDAIEGRPLGEMPDLLASDDFPAEALRALGSLGGAFHESFVASLNGHARAADGGPDPLH